MNRLKLLIILLITIWLVMPATAQSIGYYHDRAVAPNPFPNGGLLPVQYGQVRVCSGTDSTVGMCPDLATVYDLNGNPISTNIGGNFGQLTTDVTGQFSFGCDASTSNYLIQVAASSSNTPILSYKITCPPNQAAVAAPIFDTRYFSGATLGLRIAAANAAAIAAGGGDVVVAETGTVANCPILIGSTSIRVNLVFTKGGSGQVTCTNGSDVIQLSDSAGLLGPYTSLATAGDLPNLYLASSASIGSMVTNAVTDGTQESALVQGAYIKGNNSATVSGAGIKFNNIHAPSAIVQTTVYDFPAAKQVWLHSAEVKLDNDWVNAGNTGNEPLYIDGASQGITVFGGFYEHPNNTHCIVTMDGSSSNSVGSNWFYGTYFEGTNGASDGAANGICLTDVFNVGGFGLKFGGAWHTGASAITISHATGVSPQLLYFTFDGGLTADGATNGLTHLVTNNITGKTWDGAQWTTQGLLRYGYAIQDILEASTSNLSTIQQVGSGSPVATLKTAGSSPTDDFLKGISSTSTQYFRIDLNGAFHSNGSANGAYFGGSTGTEGQLRIQSDRIQCLTSSSTMCPLIVGALNVSNVLDTLLAPTNGIYSLGQIQTGVTTGTAPFITTSTTPVAHFTAVPVTYNHSGTQLTDAHVVVDSCTLGTNCAVTLSGAAVFTSSSSYTCNTTDVTATNATAIAYTSGSQFTITGTGTDVIRYSCTGN